MAAIKLSEGDNKGAAAELLFVAPFLKPIKWAGGAIASSLKYVGKSIGNAAGAVGRGLGALRNVAGSIYRNAKNVAVAAFEKTVGRFGNKQLLQDEYLPASLGAAAKTYVVKGGGVLQGKIVGKETIAKGGKIRTINFLVDKFGGDRRNWVKLKGFSDIRYPTHTARNAEIHWYEHPQVGKVLMKPKA